MSNQRPRAANAQVSRRRFGALVSTGAAGLIVPTFIARAQTLLIRIHSIQSLTGPSGSVGIRSRDGSIVATEELNNAGGFTDSAGQHYAYELISSDMANDPRQAVTLYRQGVADPLVIATVGPLNSVGFVPIVPIAGQLQLPVLSTGSGAPIQEWNTFAYRVNPNFSQSTVLMLKRLVELEKPKRLAVIYDQTQDQQANDALVCRSMQKELGYDLVADEAFRSGDRDFAPQIAKIRVARPDLLWLAATQNEGPNIVLQLREAGIDKPLITGGASFQDATYWDSTKGAILGCYTWLAVDMEGRALKAFVDAYNARFPQAAMAQTIFGYDAVMVVHEALKRAGTVDRLKLQKELTNFDMTTKLGSHITFKNPPHGDNLNLTIYVVRITGRNKYVVV
jgi:branched-chain amino acid transport system substrate-binding protein